MLDWESGLSYGPFLLEVFGIVYESIARVLTLWIYMYILIEGQESSPKPRVFELYSIVA